MIRVAVAGVGTIGSVVCRALIGGIEGFQLVAASSMDVAASRAAIDRPEFDLPFFSLDDLPMQADWVIEALPAACVPSLVTKTLQAGKVAVVISSAALIANPDVLDTVRTAPGRLLVPSGAIAGMDGIAALREGGIECAKIRTSKNPRGYRGAPYVVAQGIDLDAIAKPTTIFSGSVRNAAQAFPANVNVAATLTLATGLSPDAVEADVVADPAATFNTHEIVVEGALGVLRFTIENHPDPANPKTSGLAARSIIALLRRQKAGLWVG
jgi:aspartate dehydrogenase